MPDYVTELGLDAERMHRRIEFLRDRAKGHLGRQTHVDRACAATLHRDAGLIALLLGKVSDARSLFHRAGREWENLGLFAGYLLESFADRERNFVAADEDGVFFRLKSAMSRDARPKKVEAEEQPFEAASRSSPRQLLNLYQATGAERRRSHTTDLLAVEILRRLAPNAAMMVGMTGLPLRGYLSLFNSLSRDVPTHRDRDLLFSMAVWRQELLTAAQADKFHWRMMQRPAALIDIDLLALGLNALENGHSAQVALEAVHDRGTATALPFLLARDLLTK
jgi:hypothetical protein